jgi:endonuclease G
MVEVKALVSSYLGTESGTANHQHIKIVVAEAVDLDPDVADDVNRVRSDQEAVFVSIRYGDRAGIERALPDAEVQEGKQLHLRGERIPKEKAYAHGGEQMPVLHFTHQLLGFVYSEVKCYS